MSLWETNNKQSKLLHLLYGVDVTQYKTEEELNEQLKKIETDYSHILNPKKREEKRNEKGKK